MSTPEKMTGTEQLALIALARIAARKNPFLARRQIDGVAGEGRFQLVEIFAAEQPVSQSFYVAGFGRKKNGAAVSYVLFFYRPAKLAISSHEIPAQ